VSRVGFDESTVSLAVAERELGSSYVVETRRGRLVLLDFFLMRNDVGFSTALIER
jgi:hypothetical protein